MFCSGANLGVAMVLLAAICEIIPATELPAQTSEVIPAGYRVRMILKNQPDRWMVGRIVGQPSDSFHVLTSAPDSLVVVPANAVTYVEVSRGRRTHARLGAALGLVAGAAFGLIATAADPAINTDANGYAVVAGFFGVLGAGAGALVGWAITSERWEPYGAPTMRAAPRLGLSLSF